MRFRFSSAGTSSWFRWHLLGLWVGGGFWLLASLFSGCFCPRKMFDYFIIDLSDTYSIQCLAVRFKMC